MCWLKNKKKNYVDTPSRLELCSVISEWMNEYNICCTFIHSFNQSFILCTDLSLENTIRDFPLLFSELLESSYRYMVC